MMMLIIVVELAPLLRQPWRGGRAPGVPGTIVGWRDDYSRYEEGDEVEPHTPGCMRAVAGRDNCC